MFFPLYRKGLLISEGSPQLLATERSSVTIAAGWVVARQRRRTSQPTHRMNGWFFEAPGPTPGTALIITRHTRKPEINDRDGNLLSGVHPCSALRG